MPKRARTAAFALVVAVVASAWSAAPALALDGGPRLQLRGELRLASGPTVGVAAVPGGWVVAGPESLTRISGTGVRERAVTGAIPPAWREAGYERLGDPDTAGGRLYVPFVQPDGARARQAVARFDATSLAFVDAVEVPQHDAAFVAVDAQAGIAYSMDRADSAELLRYDVAHGWRPLPPLGLGRTLEQVRGGDFTSGAVWLSTDDARHGVYRVDTRTGVVTDLGSAGHLDGVVGGVDATTRAGERVRVAVNDGDVAALTRFALVGARTDGPAGEDRSGWPPVLVMGAIALVVLGGGAAAVLAYRAWVGLRPRPRRT